MVWLSGPVHLSKSQKNDRYTSKHTYSSMQKALGELDVTALGFAIPYIIRSSVASSSVTGCVGIAWILDYKTVQAKHR